MIGENTICEHCFKKDKCSIYYKDKNDTNKIITLLKCKYYEDPRWEIIEIIGRCPYCRQKLSLNIDCVENRCPFCGKSISYFEIEW